jgi:hypothetical protein
VAVPLAMRSQALQRVLRPNRPHRSAQASALDLTAGAPIPQTPATQAASENSTNRERELRRAKLRAEGARLKGDQFSHLNERPDIQNPFWQSKVALLKAWLAELPERDIPEIRLCTDRDWLLTAEFAELNSELGARKALGSLRNGAKSRFAKTIITAINQYSAQHDSKLPTDLADIQPFLDPALAQSVLQRYQLSYRTPDGQPSAAGLAVTERAPVDVDFDTRHEIGFYGYTIQLVGHAQPR